MSLTEAHRLTSQMESRLRGAIPGVERVVIHAEPLEE